MASTVQRRIGAGARGADVATRRRVRRLVAASRVEPEGLPPAAILVVRSLPDPLPGRLQPQQPGVRPPGEWERAARAALSGRLRAAARPVRGLVPTGADALLFVDRAEMLAAFARDAAAGSAHTRWWWAALVRGLPAGDLTRSAALWVRDARYVPAALEHLASWGVAERVLAALPADQVTRILVAVAHAFGLPTLLAATPSRLPVPTSFEGLRHPTDRMHPAVEESAISEAGSEVAEEDEGTTTDPVPAPRERRAPTRERLVPPWERLIPPALVPRRLAPERQALLGAGLLLHRAPLVARSPDFVAAFVRWRAAAAGQAEPPARPPAGSGPSLRPAPHSPEPRLGAPHAAEPSAPAMESAAISIVEGTGGSEVTRDRGARSLDSGTPEVTGRRTAAKSGTAPREVGTDPALPRWRPPPFEQEEIHSSLCGAFFLVNVYRSIDFFRALDEHFRLPSIVGAWGWIELLARCLLGPHAPAAAGDPLWRLLAALDGREPGAPAGAGFLASEVETLPERWAEILATPGAAAPEGVLPLGMEPDPLLRRFLDRVVPFVRLRVEATLRAAGADEPLETALFRRTGLIQSTRSHLDVRMALDQVSLPVRLAGLDASPGWVPELGRVVTFHFLERTP